MSALGADPRRAPLRIRAVLEARGPAAAIVLSERQVGELGSAVRTPPVRVTVNGHTFEGRVARMRGETLIGLSRAVREACGVEAGEEWDFEIVIDDGPRTVALPAELEAALAVNEDARKGFDALAPSHKKEYARWVGEAKKAETRERRVTESIGKLLESKPR